MHLTHVFELFKVYDMPFSSRCFSSALKSTGTSVYIYLYITCLLVRVIGGLKLVNSGLVVSIGCLHLDLLRKRWYY